MSEDIWVAAKKAAHQAGMWAGAQPVQGGGWRLGNLKVEKQRLATLLRDISFNPFRPPPTIVEGALAWNDGCVVKLATSIYEERDFSPERMSVLADALEEAGVTDQEVLGHCRQQGAIHVRGCWLVDLLLGRE